jgi:hypothetical protein
MKKPWITQMVFVASFMVPVIVLGQSQPSGASRSVPGGSKFVSSGEVLRVCAVVYADFSADLKKHFSHPANDLEKYSSNIGNYVLEVSESDDAYVVVLRPRQDREHVIYGGQTRYEVSRKTFEILKKVKYR